MKLPRMLLALATVPIFGACSSDVVDAILNADDLRAAIDTVDHCLPPLLDKAGNVFDVTKTWEFSKGTFPDPEGVSSTISTFGAANMLTIVYEVDDCTITMGITFHGPGGSLEAIDFGKASSASERVSVAATQLRDTYPAANQLKFMLGRWTITSTATVESVTGSGNMVGVIGGTDNQNELERLITTTDDFSGGIPPVAPGLVNITTMEGMCDLSFTTSDLQTDTVLNQEYPIGTINITVVGETTVTGSMTFDGTDIAIVRINKVPGYFEFDLDNAVDPVNYVAP